MSILYNEKKAIDTTMTPLPVLLTEIWAKDKTFYIEQGCFSPNVRMINRPSDDSEPICIETDSLGQTIQRVWSLLYREG